MDDLADQEHRVRSESRFSPHCCLLHTTEKERAEGMLGDNMETVDLYGTERSQWYLRVVPVVASDSWHLYRMHWEHEGT
jgi:hypothetical protein